MAHFAWHNKSLIDPPPQNNSKGNSPNPALGPKTLFTEPPGTEDTKLVDGILPNSFSNTTIDQVEDLEEINSLPDLTESQQQ